MSWATLPSLRRDLDAPEPFPAVKFNWIHPSPFESLFAVDSKINRVHIQCFGYDWLFHRPSSVQGSEAVSPPERQRNREG